MPLPAILAGVSAAASIGGAVIGGKAQKKAAKTAAAAMQQNTQANNQLTREIYDQNSANMRPFMDTGVDSMGQLSALLRGDSGAFDNFRNSTNYQFMVDQGNRGINQGYAARGALQSGAAQKALVNYNQGMAGNALGGYMDILRGREQMGMHGAGALAGYGQNMANNVTANNNMAAGASANAALMRGAANANMWGGIAQGIGNFASSFGGGKGF
jgi:hypothetical protein